MCFWQENILNGVPEKIGTATEVIASIPTRMAPVLPEESGATVLKSALQRVIEFSKKGLRCLSPVSIRSQLFESRGNEAQRFGALRRSGIRSTNVRFSTNVY